ncbi:MAG: hypothetical protein HY812_14845 [Planctomycetes bacterium]|nr:hypothetical protein [Planctomycetota bacterium]
MSVPARTLIVLVHLALGGLALPPGEALAQLAPGQNPNEKKRSGSGSSSLVGKKSRLTGSIYDDAARRDEESDRALVAGEVLIRLGDRVEGRTGSGIADRVLFEAVKGTRVSLVLQPADRKLTLVARLLRPDGAPLAFFRPKRADPAVAAVHDELLPETGIYVAEISFAANQTGDYSLDTLGLLPVSAEETLALRDGRPEGFKFGGLSERSIEEVRVVALGGAELDLALNIVAPQGNSVPLADKAWKSSDGRTLIVRDVPVDRLGDYALFVTDTARGEGKARVEVIFKNPRPLRATHQL